jgi:diphthamide biosynthesis protein 2
MYDAKSYYRPMVTPFELEIALTGVGWIPGGDSGQYVSDITTLSERLKESVVVDSDEPHFSLASGKLEGAGVEIELEDKDEEGVVSVRRDGQVSKRVLKDGADFLSQRSFRGLEVGLEQARYGVIEDGRGMGIARGYEGEGGEN